MAFSKGLIPSFEAPSVLLVIMKDEGNATPIVLIHVNLPIKVNRNFAIARHRRKMVLISVRD